MRSDLQHLHPWNAAVVVLNEAIQAGLVRNTIGQLDYPGVITVSALDYADSLFRSTGTPNTADKENAGSSPKSIHFLETSIGLKVHPTTVSPYPAWSIELCRFVVPHGKVGIVKAFEQYLAQRAEGQNPAYVYTASPRWGIPGPWHTGIANELSNAGTWHFRLRSISRMDPEWWELVGAGTLPDIPYTDFANEAGLWWPAGSAASQNVHLIVPAGHMLRVFYSSPAQTVRLEVAAKLKGYTQSDRSPETAYNVRTHY